MRPCNSGYERLPLADALSTVIRNFNVVLVHIHHGQQDIGGLYRYRELLPMQKPVLSGGDGLNGQGDDFWSLLLVIFSTNLLLRPYSSSPRRNRRSSLSVNTETLDCELICAFFRKADGSGLCGLDGGFVGYIG